MINLDFREYIIWVLLYLHDVAYFVFKQDHLNCAF